MWFFKKKQEKKKKENDHFPPAEQLLDIPKGVFLVDGNARYYVDTNTCECIFAYMLAHNLGRNEFKHIIEWGSVGSVFGWCFKTKQGHFVLIEKDNGFQETRVSTLGDEKNVEDFYFRVKECCLIDEFKKERIEL